MCLAKSMSAAPTPGGNHAAVVHWEAETSVRGERPTKVGRSGGPLACPPKNSCAKRQGQAKKDLIVGSHGGKVGGGETAGDERELV